MATALSARHKLRKSDGALKKASDYGTEELDKAFAALFAQCLIEDLESRTISLVPVTARATQIILEDFAFRLAVTPLPSLKAVAKGVMVNQR